MKGLEDFTDPKMWITSPVKNTLGFLKKPSVSGLADVGAVQPLSASVINDQIRAKFTGREYHYEAGKGVGDGKRKGLFAGSGRVGSDYYEKQREDERQAKWRRSLLPASGNSPSASPSNGYVAGSSLLNQG